MLLTPLSTYYNNNLKTMITNPFEKRVTRLTRRVPTYIPISNKLISSNSLNNGNLLNYTHKYEIVDTTYIPIQKNNISLPKIQMGLPINNNSLCKHYNNCNCCHHCNNFNLKDLIILLHSFQNNKESINNNNNNNNNDNNKNNNNNSCSMPRKTRIFFFENSPEKDNNENSDEIKYEPPIRSSISRKNFFDDTSIPSIIFKEPKKISLKKRKKSPRKSLRKSPRKSSRKSPRKSPRKSSKTNKKQMKKIRKLRINKKKKMIDWWKLAKDFTELFVYYKTAIKYSKNRKIRNKRINERNKIIGNELLILKDWIISIEQPFWNEFKVFKNLNLSFKHSNSKVKKEKEIQKIIAIIKKYMENLILKTQKLKDIPLRIQKILYNFIKERNYFPKLFLSTNQVNRLDFHFYGFTRMMNESQRSMLLSFLLINGVTVQQILLHIGDHFAEFKNLKDIYTSAKIIGSIIHYLTRDTYSNNPNMIKNFFALLNYYKNYHLNNNEINNCEDIFGDDMIYKDYDEFTKYLINKSDLSEFWDFNKKFVETYQQLIYGWGVKLSNLIINKFAQNDPDLKPRKRLKRPPNKTIK